MRRERIRKMRAEFWLRIIFLTWTDATERRAFRALSLSVQAETEANSGRARSMQEGKGY